MEEMLEALRTHQSADDKAGDIQSIAAATFDPWPASGAQETIDAIGSKERWLEDLRVLHIAITTMTATKEQLARPLAKDSETDEAVIDMCETFEALSARFAGLADLCAGAHARLVCAIASAAIKEEGGS